MSNGAYHTSYTGTDSIYTIQLSQLNQQNMVHPVQQLNKHTYIMGNKLYINGLDIVRLI